MFSYYNTIQIPIQPLLDQHQLSLVPVQALVQPCQYLLVSLNNVFIRCMWQCMFTQLLAQAVQLHVLCIVCRFQWKPSCCYWWWWTCRAWSVTKMMNIGACTMYLYILSTDWCTCNTVLWYELVKREVCFINSQGSLHWTQIMLCVAVDVGHNYGHSWTHPMHPYTLSPYFFTSSSLHFSAIFSKKISMCLFVNFFDGLWPFSEFICRFFTTSIKTYSYIFTVLCI